MGSYYLKKLKNQKWSLYHQSYSGGNRVQERVSDIALLDLGLHPEDGYIKAYEKVKLLNQSNSREKDKIRKSAKRVEELSSLNEELFPQAHLVEFQSILEQENFGSEKHLKKLHSHFNFIQKMCVSLNLDASEFKSNSKKIYKYFIEQKISPSYASRLITILNRWGVFVSKSRNKFYEEVQIPKGNQLSAIADAQQTKSGINTELGVRTESLPLSPEKLNTAKGRLSGEHYNWLFLSIWLGLRPEEVDLLKNLKRFKVEADLKRKLTILHVYQSKLRSVAENKRWKYIPIIFPEQFRCLEIIKDGRFERPLNKTVRKHVGSGITLYGGRKGFVDLMLSKGQKLEDISMWLGHKDISTTWLHYKDKVSVGFTLTSETKLRAIK